MIHNNHQWAYGKRAYFYDDPSMGREGTVTAGARKKFRLGKPPASGEIRVLVACRDNCGANALYSADEYGNLTQLLAVLDSNTVQEMKKTLYEARYSGGHTVLEDASKGNYYTVSHESMMREDDTHMPRMIMLNAQQSPGGPQLPGDDHDFEDEEDED